MEITPSRSRLERLSVNPCRRMWRAVMEIADILISYLMTFQWCQTCFFWNDHKQFIAKITDQQIIKRTKILASLSSVTGSLAAAKSSKQFSSSCFLFSALRGLRFVENGRKNPLTRRLNVVVGNLGGNIGGNAAQLDIAFRRISPWFLAVVDGLGVSVISGVLWEFMNVFELKIIYLKKKVFSKQYE